MTTTTTHATIADLYNVPEGQKAELVRGRLIYLSPTGSMPGYASTRIVRALDEYGEQTGSGSAMGGNVAFVVNLPNRQSFSPDAAFHTGPLDTMDFLTGAPLFAVEVRSKGDYGPAAERAMALKRADYFAAGTRVVWDVDLLGTEVVRVYRADKPEQATVYRRGERAEAEPALPGWTMPVDDLFPKTRPFQP